MDKRDVKANEKVTQLQEVKNEKKNEKIYIPLTTIIKFASSIGEALQDVEDDVMIFTKEALIDSMLVQNYGNLEELPLGVEGEVDILELYDIVHCDGYMDKLKARIINYKDVVRLINQYVSRKFSYKTKIKELCEKLSDFNVDEAKELLSDFGEEKVGLVKDIAEKIN